MFLYAVKKKSKLIDFNGASEKKKTNTSFKQLFKKKLKLKKCLWSTAKFV